MTKPIIEVNSISKCYRLGEYGAGSLREELAGRLAQIFRRKKAIDKGGTESASNRLATKGSNAAWKDSSKKSAGNFWALRNISFSVMPGEVLGIIGRNGAGKSTLLKILSRITEPTTGEAVIRGRVASLLEVGTGFHPELSGRENIYVNGAILGMKKREIDSKLNEIVAFAEVEHFLDTPVKRYSSGMYVRLAFAVAAHLEPEILIIDEILAVGDAQFQKKCLGKVTEIAGRGRTVLFVSHNTNAVAGLCNRAVWLSNGEKRADGASSDVLEEYVRSQTECQGEIVWDEPANAPGNQRVRFKGVRIVSQDKTTSEVDIGQECTISLDYLNLCGGLRLTASVFLIDKMGIVVFQGSNLPSLNNGEDKWFGKSFPAGLFRTTCTIPAYLLNEGRYSIRVALSRDVAVAEVVSDEILSFNAYDPGIIREYFGKLAGVVRPRLTWRTEQLHDGHL